MVPFIVIEVRTAILRVAGSEVMPRRIFANPDRAFAPTFSGYLELKNPARLGISSSVNIWKNATRLLIHWYSALPLSFSECAASARTGWAEVRWQHSPGSFSFVDHMSGLGCPIFRLEGTRRRMIGALSNEAPAHKRLAAR